VFHLTLSSTYRDPVVVPIASVVLSAEPEDRVRPVLITQQHFVVLTLVHLGLDPVCGVPILEQSYVTLLSEQPNFMQILDTSLEPLTKYRI
jgi:hypothetical protein